MKKNYILCVFIILIIIVLMNFKYGVKEKEILSYNFNEESNLKTNFAEKIKSLYNWTESPAIYYHDSYLTHGAHDNSYRYSGSNDEIHNYVCFGYDKIPENGSCSEEYLYRIIGIFDDDKDGKYQIKLIKNDYVNKDVLGTDGNSTNNGFSSTLNDTYKGSKEYVDSFFWLYPDKELTNDWDNSELNNTNLNKNFINYIQDWKYLIDDNNWQIGGLTFADALNNNAKNIFESEITNNKQNKTVENKIGLMYVSDYMYAAKPKFWEYKSYSDTEEDYEQAKESNWLYQGLDEWTISKRSDSTSSILYIMNKGKIQSYDGKIGYAVRPTFYLKWNVNYLSGDGTKETPYIVSKTMTENGNSYAETCNDGSAACLIARKSLNDNTIIYHNTDALANKNIANKELSPNDDSYRYSGSSESVQNYVCLDGTSTENECSSDANLYRIIGLFPNKSGEYEMKLIKADFATVSELGSGGNSYGANGTYYDYINSEDNTLGNVYDAGYNQYKSKHPHADLVGGYYWQEEGDCNTKYNWNTTKLNTEHLNGTFLNSLNTNVQSAIVSHDWEISASPIAKVVGLTTSTNAKIAYDYSLGSSNTEKTSASAKIGLMYTTDYYYAALPKYWSLSGWLQNNNESPYQDYRDAINDNWMYLGLYEWTISGDLDGGEIYLVKDTGSTDDYCSGWHAWAVRPTFYLSSATKIAGGGDGSKTNPYRLDLSE